MPTVPYLYEKPEIFQQFFILLAKSYPIFCSSKRKFSSRTLNYLLLYIKPKNGAQSTFSWFVLFCFHNIHSYVVFITRFSKLVRSVYLNTNKSIPRQYVQAVSFILIYYERAKIDFDMKFVGLVDVQGKNGFCLLHPKP